MVALHRGQLVQKLWYFTRVDVFPALRSASYQAVGKNPDEWRITLMFFCQLSHVLRYVRTRVYRFAIVSRFDCRWRLHGAACDAGSKQDIRTTQHNY